MKQRKILIIIIVSFILLFITSMISIADSGWDYDYGGDWGGSDWGGSDWGGSDWDSSDWDYDYDNNYSTGSTSSGGGSDEFDLGECIAFCIMLLVAFSPMIFLDLITRKKRKNTNAFNSSTFSNIPTVISDEEYEKYPEFNKDDFLKQAYDIYVGVQQAWSDFDYDMLRKLTTDEMFNMYKMQLETLKLKNQKNVMENFRKSVMGITKINNINGILTVTVRLNVYQKDYVIDTITNDVIRGSKERTAYVCYELIFINNKGTGNPLTICPNCGASIKNNSSQKCEYCNSDLVGNSTNNWVLAKKENIRQGR